MRICCVISSLDLGGAQRVMTTLAAAWAQRGDDVSLITLSEPSTDFFALDPRVARVPLALERVSSNRISGLGRNLQRIVSLRRAIGAARPDVVLSFIDATNLLVLVATRGLAVPVVVSERTFPGAQRIGLARHVLRWFLYRAADTVVAQTAAGALWLQQHTLARVVVELHNPIPAEPYADGALVPRRSVVLAAGRLSREKGFDLLLDAWYRLAPQRPGWRLRILGEGPERQRLERQVRELGLEDLIELPGRVSDMDAELRAASVFVLPSRFEGFPNALLEAMAAGCRCIAFDCPTGPREILERLGDGILVPAGDLRRLTDAVAKETAAPEPDADRVARGHRTREAFGIGHCLQGWDRVFDNVIGSRK